MWEIDRRIRDLHNELETIQRDFERVTALPTEGEQIALLRKIMERSQRNVDGWRALERRLMN